VSLDLNSILVQEAGLSAAEVDGRIVVLSLKSGSYFDLNAVASKIWDMLSTPCSIESILQDLSRQHDVDTQTLTRDVMSFLQSLLAQRLVRIVAVEEAR
jgi:hypothetical protein